MSDIRPSENSGQSTPSGTAISRRLLNSTISWTKRNKATASVIAVLVATVVILVSKKEDKPFANFPNAQQYAAATQPASSLASPASQPSATTAPANVWSPPLHDPDSLESEPNDQLPAILSGQAVHELIIDSDTFATLIAMYKNEGTEFDTLESSLATPAIRDALYDRIRTGRGFLYPELSLRWSEFSSADRADFWNDAVIDYCAGRIERIRSAILAGSLRQGDVKFVAAMTPFLAPRAAKLVTWVNGGRHLQQWLADDDLIDGDKIPDNQRVDLPPIETLLARYHADAVQRATPRPRPTALTPQDMAKIVAEIDQLIQKGPEGKPRLRWTPGTVIRDIYLEKPAFSKLELIEDARRRYELRRTAFAEIRPLIRHAISQATAKDPKLGTTLHDVLAQHVVLAPSPWPDTKNPPTNEYSAEGPELHHALQALNYLRDRAFRGVANSDDSAYLSSIKTWIASSLDGYEQQQVRMDDLVNLIRHSGDKSLINAIGSEKIEWQKSGQTWEMHWARFSREPELAWDAQECPYPLRVEKP